MAVAVMAVATAAARDSSTLNRLCTASHRAWLHRLGVASDEQYGLAPGLLLVLRSTSTEVRLAAFAVSSSSGQKPGANGGGSG
eukprot:5279425-Prymnesium_polylepis.1